MLQNLLSGGDIRPYLISILLSLPIVLISLSLHEASHGYVASKLGDPTAKSLGRITLNPLKHLDPMGFVSMLLFGFGWANPVPINTRHFKKPRRDMAISAAAGPISNLCLAVIFTCLLKLASSLIMTVDFWLTATETQVIMAEYLMMFLITGIRLNVTLAIFNLIPIPPFDGSRILFAFLPPKQYFGIMKYEKYINIGFFLLLFLGVFDPVLDLVTGKTTSLLLDLFQIY